MRRQFVMAKDEAGRRVGGRVRLDVKRACMFSVGKSGMARGG